MMLIHDNASGTVPFPRISTWWMLLLQVCTGGLFGALWLAERKDRFNSVPGHEAVRTRDLVSLALLMGFPLFFSGVAESEQTEAEVVNFVSAMCSLAAVVVVMILISFRLTDWIQARASWEFGVGRFSTNKLWAFLFQFLYLNYKLNQIARFRQISGPIG